MIKTVGSGEDKEENRTVSFEVDASNATSIYY